MMDVNWEELLELLASDNSACVAQGMQLAENSLPPFLALTIIRSLSSHPDWGVRDDAAERLGELGNDQDVYRLLLLSRDREWVVRCSAASSLAGFPLPKVRKRLRQMAKRDRIATVRKWAIVALLDAGDDGTLLEFVCDVETTEESPFALLAIYSVYAHFGLIEQRPKVLALLDHPELNRDLRGRSFRSQVEELYSSPDWFGADG